MRKFMYYLANFLYGFVGGINIVVGLFHSKDFWQIMTGCLFMILLLDRLTITTLNETIEMKEKIYKKEN